MQQEGYPNPSAPPIDIDNIEMYNYADPEIPPEPPKYEEPRKPSSVVEINEPEPNDNYDRNRNDNTNTYIDLAAFLYCMCCVIFFVPFGWLFGMCTIYLFAKIRRDKTWREKVAYMVLIVCMILNFIFSVVMTSFM